MMLGSVFGPVSCTQWHAGISMDMDKEIPWKALQEASTIHLPMFIRVIYQYLSGFFIGTGVT